MKIATATVALGLLACSAVFAAPKGEGKALDGATARYQKERAACLDGRSNQDRRTCLYEAQSAYNEARRGKVIDTDPSALEANARKRCEPLPQDERLSCLKRMDGYGLVVGNVLDGGIYRELTEVVVGTH